MRNPQRRRLLLRRIHKLVRSKLAQLIPHPADHLLYLPTTPFNRLKQPLRHRLGGFRSNKRFRRPPPAPKTPLAN